MVNTTTTIKDSDFNKTINIGSYPTETGSTGCGYEILLETKPIDFEKFLKSIPRTVPQIKQVIFNPPATIVLWWDGSKTVVKTHHEMFNEEHGLAMAIARKYFGDNRSAFKKAVREGKRNER